MNQITEYVAKLQSRLHSAAQVAGRDPAEISILAVSKQQSIAAIRSVAAAGFSHFGENYVQEGLEKIAVAGTGLCWHFIGRLQSNKTRLVANSFDWVHTIDSLRLAQRLSTAREDHDTPLQVCIQVNVDDTGEHGGIDPERLADLCGDVVKLPGLRLRGLMAIPTMAIGMEAQRIPLRRLRLLFEEMQSRGYDLDTLSMGMSADLEAAIMEGSTMLRIGTALFGPRP